MLKETQNEPTKKIKLVHKKLLLFAVATGMIALVLSIFLYVNRQKPNLTIKDVSLVVEVAATETTREKGLCCRKSLPEKRGMLFIFELEGDHRFWMKDTLIPLDIFWINNQKRIVHIERNVQPSSYPDTFGSDQPAKYVLETNAGFAKKHRISIGDPVSL